MNGTMKSEESREKDKPLASEALRHPLRVRILEVVNERDISPVQFMNQGLAPSLEISAKTLSSISYHFREPGEMRLYRNRGHDCPPRRYRTHLSRSGSRLLL